MTAGRLVEKKRVRMGLSLIFSKNLRLKLNLSKLADILAQIPQFGIKWGQLNKCQFRDKEITWRGILEGIEISILGPSD